MKTVFCLVFILFVVLANAGTPASFFIFKDATGVVTDFNYQRFCHEGCFCLSAGESSPTGAFTLTINPAISIATPQTIAFSARTMFPSANLTYANLRLTFDGCVGTVTIPAIGDGWKRFSVAVVADGGSLTATNPTPVPLVGCNTISSVTFNLPSSPGLVFDAIQNFPSISAALIGQVCGDGVVNPLTEQCDDGNRVDNDFCTNSCKLPRCGDGIVQFGVPVLSANPFLFSLSNAFIHNILPSASVFTANKITDPLVGQILLSSGLLGGEECDDGNSFNNDTCTNLCRFPRCGDGIVSPGAGEACDDGNLNPFDFCTSTCQLARCGDGIVQAGVEQCDDGNRLDFDFCTNRCQFARCGDGVKWLGVEQCDDGALNGQTACSVFCTLQVCGDGFIQPNIEGCDDGNLIPFDWCLPTCKRNVCGDGIVNTFYESCDDGNFFNGDLCNNECEVSRCGDGFVSPLLEQCDDRNTVNTDDCTNVCRFPFCGDGVVWGTFEECDDGNTNPFDSCTLFCRAARCGDGILQLGVEQCDDGNNIATDFCTNECTINVCGDGVVFTGVEECDDGNIVNNDACTNFCRKNTKVRPCTTQADCPCPNCCDFTR